jgi:hypothetical protein
MFDKLQCLLKMSDLNFIALRSAGFLEESKKPVFGAKICVAFDDVIAMSLIYVRVDEL